jgi:hypothetical protein
VEGVQLDEGLGEVGLGDGFVADEEGLEDRLVDQPADGVIATAVKVVEVVAEDLQRQLKGRGDVVVVDAQTGDDCFSVLAALLDAGLLFVEELTADALVVVHVQELSLLLLEPLQNTLGVVDLPFGDRDPLTEIVRDRCADFLAFGLAKRDGGVVVLDGCLYAVDRLVAL